MLRNNFPDDFPIQGQSASGRQNHIPETPLLTPPRRWLYYRTDSIRIHTHVLGLDNALALT
jgi:hypothetical protein